MITEKLVHFASASGCSNQQIQTLFLPLRLYKKWRWSTKCFLLRPMASLCLCNWQPNWDPFASAHLVIGLPWWLRRWSSCLQSRKPGVQPLGWAGPLGRAWLPTPVFSPGDFTDRGAWRATVRGGHKDTFTTFWCFRKTYPIVKQVPWCFSSRGFLNTRH